MLRLPIRIDEDDMQQLWRLLAVVAQERISVRGEFGNNGSKGALNSSILSPFLSQHD